MISFDYRFILKLKINQLFCNLSALHACLKLHYLQMWHKKCFSCSTCHRPLDSTLACDGPDKEIYCRACYGKYFGPKGFGYGHSPTLISTKGESTILL